MPLPEPKLKKAREAAEAGDWVAALRIIAKFPQLGDHKDAITRGWNARRSPDLYREMGQDPDELWNAAVRAACARYGWPVPEFAQGSPTEGN